MNNPLKIGIISGLIAGIIAGLVAVFITVPLIFELGQYYWGLASPPETPFMKIATTEITINVIWGILLGIIYSRIYHLILGKGISKGLLFGLVYYLIFSIRNLTWVAAYSYYNMIVPSLLTMAPIIYGLVLGIIYKTPEKKLKFKKYDIKDGVIPGAITGIIFSICAVISYVIAAYFGAIFGFTETYPNYLKDIYFILNQFGTHATLNIFWMGIYGAIYAMFYDAIPGQGVLKGSIYGLFIWLITSFRNGLNWLMYGSLSMALWAGLTAFLIYIFFGLVLEGFYKKNARAFLAAGVVFVIDLIFSIFVGLLS